MQKWGRNKNGSTRFRCKFAKLVELEKEKIYLENISNDYSSVGCLANKLWMKLAKHTALQDKHFMLGLPLFGAKNPHPNR